MNELHIREQAEYLAEHLFKWERNDGPGGWIKPWPEGIDGSPQYRNVGYVLSHKGAAEIIELIGEQVTWELLNCEGKWYVWLSNNDKKWSAAHAELPKAVAMLAYDALTSESPLYEHRQLAK